MIVYFKQFQDLRTIRGLWWEGGASSTDRLLQFQVSIQESWKLRRCTFTWSLATWLQISTGMKNFSMAITCIAAKCSSTSALQSSHSPPPEQLHPILWRNKKTNRCFNLARKLVRVFSSPKCCKWNFGMCTQLTQLLSFSSFFPDLTQTEVLLKVDPELGNHDWVLIKDQSWCQRSKGS